jgi:hypothetical protein
VSVWQHMCPKAPPEYGPRQIVYSSLPSCEFCDAPQPADGGGEDCGCANPLDHFSPSGCSKERAPPNPKDLAIEQLTRERDALKRELESSRDWYATRFERLREWVDALSIPEETRNEYFNIVANGTAAFQENPTHAQLLSLAKHRAERAETDRDRYLAWSENAEHHIKTLNAEKAKAQARFEAEHRELIRELSEARKEQTASLTRMFKAEQEAKDAIIIREMAEKREAEATAEAVEVTNRTLDLVKSYLRDCQDIFVRIDHICDYMGPFSWEQRARDMQKVAREGLTRTVMANYDVLYERMQLPDAKKAAREAFSATPEELAAAATAEAANPTVAPPPEPLEAAKERMLQSLSALFHQPVLPIHRYCAALFKWVDCIIETNQNPTPAYPGQISHGASYYAVLPKILMDVQKSGLLERLLYRGEKARAVQCPEHKGHMHSGMWVGLGDACPHGCEGSGWLPNDSK